MLAKHGCPAILWMLLLLTILPVVTTINWLLLLRSGAHSSRCYCAHRHASNLFSSSCVLLCCPRTLHTLSILRHTWRISSHAIIIEVLPDTAAIVIDIVAFWHSKVPQVHAPALRNPYLLARFYSCCCCRGRLLVLVPSMEMIHPLACYACTSGPVLPVVSGLPLTWTLIRPFKSWTSYYMLGTDMDIGIGHAIIIRIT